MNDYDEFEATMLAAGKSLDEIERLWQQDYDGAPYCSYGHRTKAQCDCGPIAANE